MASLRTRIELNKGRIGIPLHKLADISKEMERFLERICEDLKIKDPSGQWLACNFENGSLSFDVEYHGQASEAQIETCKSSLQCIAKGPFTSGCIPVGISRKTLMQYSKIADHLDADEVIRIGIYSKDEEEPAEENWHSVHKQQLLEIKNVILHTIDCYGAIQATIHTLYKDSDYLVARDIVTKRLIKCYFRSSQYSCVLDVLSPKDAIVHISGMMQVSRMDHRIERIDVERLEAAKSYRPGDLDRFIGCAPNLTGPRTTSAFIAGVRHHDE